MSVLWRWLDWSGWWTVAGLPVLMAIIFAILMVPTPADERQQRLCDEQVSVLLTTKDIVELQRAQFLVNWFRCSIERRLP
jgi:hypothetical protein